LFGTRLQLLSTSHASLTGDPDDPGRHDSGLRALQFGSIAG
jgi:hypothetical protein